jgi:ribosomal protein S18 acetylase RimI-like enzyme
MTAPQAEDPGPEASPPEIRHLTRADLPELVSVWNRAGLTTRPAGRDHPDRLAAELAEFPRNFLGAFERGTLVGGCIATWDGRRAWINRLAVIPSRRRTGVAQALVAAAESELRSRGALLIAVLVEPHNSASLSLFNRLGYRDVPSAVYLSKRDRPDA